MQSEDTVGAGSRSFVVIVNDEGQYCLWPGLKEVPIGWTTAVKAGSREACLSFIELVWTDMRPASLRDRMNVD